MSPEAKAIKTFALDLLLDRQGLQDLPLLIPTSWELPNVGGGIDLAQGGCALLGADKRVYKLLLSAKKMASRVWEIIRVEILDSEGGIIMSKKLKTEVGVFVKNGERKNDREPYEILHSVQIPAEYEPFLVDRTTFEYHFSNGWGWNTYKAVPTYAEWVKYQSVVGDIKPQQIAEFNEIPSEETLVGLIIDSQRQLARLIEQHKENEQAEWNGRGFKASPYAHKQYLIDKDKLFEIHQEWVRQMEQAPNYMCNGVYKVRELLVNRVGGLAKWLLKEYGEFDPTTGWDHLEVPGFIYSHRLVPALPAMAIAGNDRGELVIRFTDGSWCNQTDSLVNINRITDPDNPYRPSVHIDEGTSEGKTYIGLLIGGTGLPLVSCWLHPELDFMFPGINQKAWELANTPPEAVKSIFEVTWMVNPWPAIMRSQW